MESAEIQSIIGLTIQCAGIYLLTILSYFITRSVRRDFLQYWTVAWGCMALALSSLMVSFRLPELQKLFLPVYFLGEYTFGYLLIAGCRNYVSGVRLAGRDLRLLVAGVCFAFILPHLSSSFDILFIPHAAVMAVLFALCVHTLLPLRRCAHFSPGLRLMMAALTLLALDFLHYIPIFSYVEATGADLGGYLKYTSIYDLTLEIMLGFGVVMVVMEDVRRAVEDSNRELVATRDRLEVLARIDPLTEALNRHGFYSLLENRQAAPAKDVSGCVVVVDMDNLKPINDRFGHNAGDAAIREVAKAIRGVIRAEDLLFRWGGDEFLILLLNITEADARRRVDQLNAALALTRLPGTSAPVPLIVSYGLACFSSMDQVERAIDEADSAMYVRKQSRKQLEPSALVGGRFGAGG